tara:strand:- start:690 stop:1118 length:429 start_codon:yes stop_codon:yes gene_type:complete
MASTVYNAAVLGTGTNNIRTLYNNTTGGNVRILWNYLETTTEAGDSHRKIYYGPTPSGTSLGHTSGNDLNTIEIVLRGGLIVGKDLAFHVQSQNTYWKMLNETGWFPLEMMLANTHKISLWTDNLIGTDEVALYYNFVVIPE